MASFNPYSSGTISTTFHRPGREFPQDGVSILILLEQSQQHLASGRLPRRFLGFNPYSSGTISTTLAQAAPDHRTVRVSILILLEQSQQQQKGFDPIEGIPKFQSLFFWNNLNNSCLVDHKIKLEHCFNPYSSGTISTTGSPKRFSRPCKRVSILILLEQSQQQSKSPAFRSRSSRVSILILLEQSQQRASSSVRRVATKCFNPYSSGTISTTGRTSSNVIPSPLFQSLFFWNNLNNELTET